MPSRRPAMPREKVLYCETYRKGAAVKKEFLPVTRHTEIYQPVEMHILKKGVVERGGEKLEFHDVRLYFPRPETSNDG